MGGWVERVELTAKQADMIRRKLSDRRDRVFHDPERQERFLCHVEGALTLLRHSEKLDLDATRINLEEVEALARNLQAKLSRITKDGASMLNLALGSDRYKNSLPAELAHLADAASSIAATLSKPRGEYNGEVSFVIHQTAAAWSAAFGRRASHTPDGAFAEVLNEVLRQVNLGKAGKDVLRSVLNPAG